MRTRSLLLVLFLQIAHYSFSQHLQVEDGDTLAVIPIEQIRVANTLFIQSDSIKAELELLNDVCLAKDSLITSLEVIDSSNRQLVDLYEKDLQAKDLYIESQKKSIRRSTQITGLSLLLLLLSIIF